MQVMPETWAELSFRYELGSDPFDPHDNVLAGTAYLREMMDRFGSEGFLAAYNAGPKRYEEHLTSGRPLPDETQAYVTRLAPLIDIEQRERGTPVGRRSGPWPQASVFLARIDSSPAGGKLAPGVCTANAPNAVSKSGMTALVPHARGLFVPRSDKMLRR